MTRPHRRTLATLVAFTLAAACVPPAGDAANPLFEAKFKDFNRTYQPLVQWRGRPLAVYFWATWCESCRREVPELVAAYDSHRDVELQIVGIAIDQTDKVEAFVKETGIPYPMLVGGNDALQLSRRLGNGVGGLPYMVIVNRDGRVVGTHIGELTPGKLTELLAPVSRPGQTPGA
ncbi:MAG: TlpA disulfide reductase family protein [Gemmatimonadales bacterium]